jgi:DNA-directed RNA polymerase subunit RPC12/RpoP
LLNKAQDFKKSEGVILMLKKFNYFYVDEVYMYQCFDCDKFFWLESEFDDTPVSCPYCGSEEIHCDREEGLVITNGSLFGR